MYDLYYFFESDLNKENLNYFYKNLPNGRLQEMFKDSMGGFNKTDKSRINVLQGYRGPHNNGSSGDSGYLSASNGLQEVRYWWGVSKRVNWIPITGLLIFLAERAEGDTNWHRLYFDSKTGECLNHDKEVAASKLNKIGNKLFDSGKFNEAREYFCNAYHHSNKKEYKENEYKAKAASDGNNQADHLDKEGNELFRQGKYEEAYNKFDQAYKKCTNGYSEEARFKSNRDAAKNNWADLVDKEGDALYNQGKYEEALAKYNKALQICSEGYKNEQIFLNNKSKAQAAINQNDQADYLNKEGNELFRQGKYEEAYNKFDQAFYKCTGGYSEEARFESNRDFAKNNWADHLHNEGYVLYNQGKYEKALEKFNKALQMCSEGYKNEQAFVNNRDKAQAALDGNNQADLQDKEGNELLRQGKYEEAYNKFDEAYNKCTNGYSEKARFKSNKDKAQAEIDALNINVQGDSLFGRGKYSEALVKYQEAYNKSQLNVQKNKYQTNINKAKYKFVCTDFSRMLSELKEFAVKLKKVIDLENENDSEIVRRYHTLSLRIGQMKMSSQLESNNQEDITDLIDPIMNLIETEIEVLKLSKILNITDQNLERKLKLLEEKLKTLETRTRN